METASYHPTTNLFWQSKLFQQRWSNFGKQQVILTRSNFDKSQVILTNWVILANSQLFWEGRNNFDEQILILTNNKLFGKQ